MVEVADLLGQSLHVDRPVAAILRRFLTSCLPASLIIASSLGTSGGTRSFGRDDRAEPSESVATDS
jgi:hypothetical protein